VGCVRTTLGDRVPRGDGSHAWEKNRHRRPLLHFRTEFDHPAGLAHNSVDGRQPESGCPLSFGFVLKKGSNARSRVFPIHPLAGVGGRSDERRARLR